MSNRSLHPDNAELAKMISAVDAKVDRKHGAVMNAFAKFRGEIRNELKPFHDYLVGQESVDQFKRDAGFRNGAGQINWMEIVKPVLTALVTALAVIAALLGVKQ